MQTLFNRSTRSTRSIPSAAILSLAMGVCGTIGGCVLPIPTIPMTLPAHGHTYEVRDRTNQAVPDDGILVITTFYLLSGERLDCYPISDGRADVPVKFDVRATPVEMFGYLSWVIPTYYIVFQNGHHAYVHPLVPGRTYWRDYFSPSINRENHLNGVQARPDVLRVFPMCHPAELKELETLEGAMQTYFIQADNSRREGKAPTSLESHNEAEAQKVVQYIQRRRIALAQQTDPAPDAESRPIVRRPGARMSTFGLSQTERAFRALDEGNLDALRTELSAGLDPNSYDKLPWTLLNRAVALGDLPAVTMLVEHGADVNRKLPRIADGWGSHYQPKVHDPAHIEKAEGFSPLALAAGCGQLEIVKYLQSKDAKVIGPSAGFTLMHAAAGELCDILVDDSPGRREVIAYLLAQGHEINPVWDSPCRGNVTPLDMATELHKDRAAAFLKEHGGRLAKDNAAPDDARKKD